MPPIRENGRRLRLHERTCWTTMLVNLRTVEIVWGDCDPAGIVYYPRYFEYFDAATTALFERALGTKKIAWTRHYGIVGIPMVETSARFIAPSRFGDSIDIETTVTELRRSSFSVQHRVLKERTLACEAAETRVWAGRDPADPERLTGVEIPQNVRERLLTPA
jgi:4-hydroxybenzoyl-CoA thioesterase